MYKAEYTIPTEEGGYDILTVAVKTLKGMEESALEMSYTWGVRPGCENCALA